MTMNQEARMRETDATAVRRTAARVGKPAPRLEWRRLLGVCFAAGLASGSASCDSPVTPTSPPNIRSADIKGAPAPLVRLLDVRLQHAYGAQVDYWSADGPRMRATTDSAQSRHELVLARLRPATTYQYEVHSSGPLGEGPAVTGSFTTDPLPAGLEVLEFTTQGTPTERLTLLESTAHAGGFRGVIIVDEEGEVVWYFEDGPVAGTARRENGNFVFQYGGRGILEVTPAGEVVAELAQEFRPAREAHHDAITTPWNTVLFIAYDTREFDGRSVSGEAIWEWDPDGGALDRRWSAWDQLSPDVDWGPASRDSDWLHANSIALGPDGNILISLRFIDQVISIAPDFSAIEWRLGGINADVEVTGSDVFVGQHTASELPAVAGRRRVLLFDNGPQSRGFSRALELELDLDAGTATTAWEFRPTPDNFSFITSLARRIPNGNTFVAFGAGPGVLASFGPVEAFEVDPAGAVQFHIEIGGPTVDDTFVLYRASPISDIAGEQIVP
jgi:hypothetical protein